MVHFHKPRFALTVFEVAFENALGEGRVLAEVNGSFAMELAIFELAVIEELIVISFADENTLSFHFIVDPLAMVVAIEYLVIEGPFAVSLVFLKHADVL